MKFFGAIFFLLLTQVSIASNNMKLEGSCQGVLQNGTEVNFTYFSDFDGCQNKINAALSFGVETHLGDYLGVRAFDEGKDVYSFKSENDKSIEAYRITLADSTGNTEGVLHYRDALSKLQSIIVSCEIRDYEYGDCRRK